MPRNGLSRRKNRDSPCEATPYLVRKFSTTRLHRIGLHRVLAEPVERHKSSTGEEHGIYSSSAICDNTHNTTWAGPTKCSKRRKYEEFKNMCNGGCGSPFSRAAPLCGV